MALALQNLFLEVLDAEQDLAHYEVEDADGHEDQPEHKLSLYFAEGGPAHSVFVDVQRYALVFGMVLVLQCRQQAEGVLGVGWDLQILDDLYVAVLYCEDVNRVPLNSLVELHVLPVTVLLKLVLLLLYLSYVFLIDIAVSISREQRVHAKKVVPFVCNGYDRLIL